MRGFFGSLFGQEQKPGQEAKPAAPVPREAPQQEEAAQLYKMGDVIGGKYEIHGTLALPSHREQSNVGLCASFMAELGGLSYMKE